MSELQRKVKDTNYKTKSNGASKLDRNGKRSNIKSRTNNNSPGEKPDTSNIIKETPAPSKPGYEAIKNLTDELEHVKQFCKTMKQTMEENCIMANEKKAFDRMKNDFIKVSADVNIIKEDMKEMMTNFHEMMQKVNKLEEENKNLRAHNKNLVKFVQSRFKSDEQIPTFRDNDYNNYYKEISEQRPKSSNINVEYSTPISEFSAFNSMHNTSSVEMNNIIGNNVERNRKRRFLLPKSDEPQYSYTINNK